MFLANLDKFEAIETRTIVFGSVFEVQRFGFLVETISNFSCDELVVIISNSELFGHIIECL